MPEKALLIETLTQIHGATERIFKRFDPMTKIYVIFGMIFALWFEIAVKMLLKVKISFMFTKRKQIFIYRMYNFVPHIKGESC